MVTVKLQHVQFHASEASGVRGSAKPAFRQTMSRHSHLTPAVSRAPCLAVWVAEARHLRNACG